MDNVILGAATGYSGTDLQPFVLSLRRTGFRGRCRIFVDSADTDARAMLASHRIEVAVADSTYPRLWRMAQRLRLGHRTTRLIEFASLRTIEPLARSSHRAAQRLYRRLAPLQASAFRYLLFLEYLLDSASGPVDRVFLLDTRDIIFQRDPFDTPASSSGITAFLEERSMTIGGCQANSNWMRACYGEAGLAAIADRPIFCSGTILGNRDAMVSYLDAIIREIARVGGRRFVPWGFDQACHNHLLHRAPPVPFHARENGASEVMHLAHRPADRLMFSLDGELLNDDGSVVSIVHQWDRHLDTFQPVIDRLLVGA